MNDTHPNSSSTAASAPPTPSYQMPAQPPAGSVVVQQVEASFHHGPIPSAKELAAYEQAFPGSVAWILNEAQASASHARSMEMKGATLQMRDALLFRVLPFVLVSLYIAATTLIAIFASTWIGSALLASGLVTVGLAYIKGTYSNGTGGSKGNP